MEAGMFSKMQNFYFLKRFEILKIEYDIFEIVKIIQKSSWKSYKPS